MGSNAENFKGKDIATRFKPGQSGNPGGRPKGIRAFIREQTDDCKEVVQFWLALLRNDPQYFKNIGIDTNEMVKKLGYKHLLDLMMQASRCVVEYGEGKPVQALEHSGPDGSPIKTEPGIDLSKLTMEELRQLAGLHVSQ